MKITVKDKAKRALSLLLSLVMALSLFTPAFAVDEEAVLYGTVEALTDGITVEGEDEILAINTEEIALDFSRADASVGRYYDGWWAGIKIVAPAGLTDEEIRSATYKRYGKDGWSDPISFWSAKDSKEGDAVHWMGAWLRATPENIANDEDGKLSLSYEFDWYGNGFDGEVQKIDFVIDTEKLTLNMDTFLGSVESFTEGLTVEGKEEITVTNSEDITLYFSKANPAEGRYYDGWWAGIKVVAPADLTEDELREVKYRRFDKDGWTEAKSFWSAKDSQEGDAVHWMGAWLRATPENIANDEDGKLSLSYEFDWYGNGFDGEVQKIDFVIDTEKLTLYYEDNYGTIEGITEGLEASGETDMTISNTDEITLDFSKADMSVGRYMDAWWVGAKIIAPSGMDASELVYAKYRTANGDSWSAEKSFWQNKDSADADEQHFITVWLPVIQDYIDNDADGILNWTYEFDWDGNGFDVSTQRFTVSIDVNKVVRIHSVGCTKVIDTEAAAPDCENPGNEEASHCEVCGLILGSGAVIPALGHDFTEVIVNDTHFKEASDGTSVYYYNCANEGCDEISTEDTYTLSDEEYNVIFGTATGITEGLTVNGTDRVTVTNADEITLDFSPADMSIGRYMDAWWVGVKILAPEGMTEDQLEQVKYRTASGSSWSEAKSFWQNKDSAEGDEEHFITIWLPVIQDYIDNDADGILNWTYEFDWDCNGFGISTQRFTVSIDVNKVVRIHSAGCTKVIDTEAAAPDCENPGNEEASHCEVCGLILGSGAVIPALGHDFTEKILDSVHLYQDKSCVSYAKYFYDCSRCDEMTSTTFDYVEGGLIPHNRIRKLDDIHLISPADCLNSAKYYMGCINCDTVFEDEIFEEGEALGHLFMVEKVTEKGGIDKDGYTNFYCIDCGEHDNEPIWFPGIGSVAISATSFDYSGKAITPAITVKDSEGTTLKNGSDYRVTYKNNIAPGTATATVTFIGKYEGSKSFNFTIRSLPGTTKVNFVSSLNAVKLSWNKVPGATGYRVYVNTANGWQKVVTTTSNTVLISNLASATRYTYAVKSYVTVNGTVYWSDALVGIYTVTKATAPANLIASQTDKAITLKWSKVAGASSYEIYKYNSTTKAYDLYKSLTGTSLTVTGLKGATAYTFLVRPVTLTKDKVKAIGEYKKITVTTKPSATTKIISSSTDITVTLKWNKVSGADGYKVYKYDAKTKSYKLYKTLTDNVITVTGLNSKTSYTFLVRPIKFIGGGKYLEGDANKITVKTTAVTKPATPSAIIASAKSGKITLKWNKVTNAAGYQVCYKDGKTGQIKLIGTVGAGTNVISKAGFTPGEKYLFGARAYKIVDGKTVYGDWAKITVTMK